MINKEDLIAQGWNYKHGSGERIVLEKGDVWHGDGIILEFENDKNNLVIIDSHSNDNSFGPIRSTKYNGMCNDMEMFEMICKLIRIDDYIN